MPLPFCSRNRPIPDKQMDPETGPLTFLSLIPRVKIAARSMRSMQNLHVPKPGFDCSRTLPPHIMHIGMIYPIASPDAPSASEFEQAAARVISRLPAEFREKVQGLVLRVEEFATTEQLRSVEIEDRWDLTGLYAGTPLPEQSVFDHAPMPPVISLFRQPLLREMEETGAGFADLVRHVVIHEAGHHFGFSDEYMHALEDMVAD